MIAFKLKQIIKMICQHVVFPSVYWFYSKSKIDDKLVILADLHHDSCPEHMQIMRKELLGRGYRVCEKYIDLAKCSNSVGMSKMLDFMKLYARAKAVFICDNYLPVASCKKRKDTKVVQLWHGSGAFKKFGYDSADDVPEKYIGNVYKNYDLVTVSSDYCVPFFESAMSIDKKNTVIATGISSTDVFFDKEYMSYCKDRFNYEYPDARGKRVVLWAPSFRGNAGLAKKQVIVGEEYIDLLAQDSRYFVIKSLHPHMCENSSNNMSTRELMICCDLLVTDYSSVFFEALILDKKILFYAPDFSEYIEHRGYYLDYDELPGEKVFEARPLDNIIDNLFINDIEIEYSKKRNIYRERYMNACDGNSTNRIIDMIF